MGDHNRPGTSAGGEVPSAVLVEGHERLPARSGGGTENWRGWKPRWLKATKSLRRNHLGELRYTHIPVGGGSPAQNQSVTLKDKSHSVIPSPGRWGGTTQHSVCPEPPVRGWGAPEVPPLGLQVGAEGAGGGVQPLGLLTRGHTPWGGGGGHGRYTMERLSSCTPRTGLPLWTSNSLLYRNFARAANWLSTSVHFELALWRLAALWY